MTYINIRTNYGVETVDEFETREEAKEMLTEYNMVQGGHYLSSKPAKDW